MKRLLWTLLALTSLAGCGDKDHPVPIPPSGTAPQTVLMYLPWSDNLYSYFLRNIADAKKAIRNGALGEGRYVVFLQNNPDDATLTELYHFDGECYEQPLKTYKGINVTQASTITAILEDVKALVPGRKYAMTIGSHGMAWIPAPGTAPSPRSAAIPYERPHWEYVSADGQFTRWFGDGASRSTNTTTLAEAISAAGLMMEYILFDDCFMSSIEVTYDLHKSARHLICSPCEVMAFGYPYDLVLPWMFTDNGSNYSLEGICRTFYDFYESYQAPNYNCGAIAVTVCRETEKMAEVMKRINTAYPQYQPEVGYSLQQYEYLYSPTRFYDFGDYVGQLCKDKTLLEEFTRQLDLTVPKQYRLHTEYYYSKGKREIRVYSGISTSAPSTSTAVTNYIRETGWYKATH